MALPLEGKIAIVTGGSRGIGKATALELARDGADVVVCARSETQGEWPGTLLETAAAVEAEGRRAIPVRADLTSDEDMQAVVEAALKGFGRIDILVNNAGIKGGPPFLSGDIALLDEFYRVNLRGPFVLSQLAGQWMAENGGGVIVNVSSGVARNPRPPADEAPARTWGGGLLYGVSKAALERFGTGIAEELKGQGVAVITLRPGYTIVERSLLAGFDLTGAQPAEYPAKAIAFVCRDPMRFTGHILEAREIIEENDL